MWNVVGLFSPKLFFGRVLTTVALFTTGLFVIHPSDAYANDISDQLLAEVDTPEITWTDCDDGFDCGTLSVPLDYANPEGEYIDLSVIRKSAISETDRIGVLFSNPGGPGGSGVSYLRASGTDNPATEESDAEFANLNERFDLVSWDPRGTVGSEPIDCLRADERGDWRYPSALYNTPADTDVLTDQSQRIKNGCVNSVDMGLLSRY